MFEVVEKVLQKNNALSHKNQGITVCTVQTQSEGFDLVEDILYEIADKKSVLYLSGGKTPQRLYEKLAQDKKLVIGASGIVDERYGEPFHDRSNEKMIKETGLLSYLKNDRTPFHPMLKKGKKREETAAYYDNLVRELHSVFQKSIGILGVGADGHTAGIAPNRANFTNPLFLNDRKYLLVSEFNDKDGIFLERVTMTFLALSMLDLLLVLVFGEDKKEALRKVFEDGPEDMIPARFYKRPEVAKKTLVITDQII